MGNFIVTYSHLLLILSQYLAIVVNSCLAVIWRLLNAHFLPLERIRLSNEGFQCCWGVFTVGRKNSSGAASFWRVWLKLREKTRRFADRSGKMNSVNPDRSSWLDPNCALQCRLFGPFKRRLSLPKYEFCQRKWESVHTEYAARIRKVKSAWWRL